MKCTLNLLRIPATRPTLRDPRRRLRAPRGALAAALLALVVALPSPAPAQGNNGDQMISIDFQNAELADVIRTMAPVIGKNFLFDDRVRGQVTIISEEMVSKEEAYRVLESVLDQKGFSIIKGPAGILKIIQKREAPQSPLRFVASGQSENSDEFVTRLIPLRYVKVDTIQDTFRQLASKDAKLIAYAPTNTMILTDTSANIRRILNIVGAIDEPTYEEQIKVIPLNYSSASELTGQLREIFGADSQSSASANRGRATAAAAARARAAAARAGNAAAGALITGADGSTVGIAGEPRFIADERTNAIVVLATQSVIREVERVIMLLDYKRLGTGRINIVPLQNADSEEMAETLQAITSGGSGGGGGAATGAAAVAAAAAVDDLEGEIRITADAPTNSLIIVSSPESFAALRDVIAVLDQRRPQVLIEALIMEVNVTDGNSFGTQVIVNTLLGGDDNNFQRLGGFGSDPIRAPIASPPFGPSTSTTTTDSMGNMTTITNSPIPEVFTGSVIGKTFSFIDQTGMVRTVPVIQGVIRAAANNSDVDIISAPKLLTADNEEAQIVVGQTLGFPTTNLQVADASNAGGQNNPFQTSSNIERQDVGVTLRVTPQISEGDTIKLDFFQEVSSVTDPNNRLGPTTSNRTVENTVFVKDGEAVMIGGIIQDQLTEVQTKVPFLGDIPILGWAFKQTSETVMKTNLLVILTPRIVREPEDLEQLTVEKREEFRSLSGGLTFSEEEREARKEALEAGLDLPLDSNPVRRILESNTRRYPTDSLPELRAQRREREDERRQRLQLDQQSSAGRYLVQVALLQSSQDAAMLLEKLIAEGYDGTVLSRDENGQVLYFVQLGPYGSEDDAQRVSREVGAQTGLRPLVLIEPQ